MGCALSTHEKDAVQRSLAIDKALASEGAYRQNEIKLLLLGEFYQKYSRFYQNVSWYYLCMQLLLSIEQALLVGFTCAVCVHVCCIFKIWEL